jgi:hypothetical protein
MLDAGNTSLRSTLASITIKVGAAKLCMDFKKFGANKARNQKKSTGLSIFGRSAHEVSAKCR